MPSELESDAEALGADPVVVGSPDATLGEFG